MSQSKLLFQLTLLLIFFFTGIFYTVKGSREKDKKSLLIGLLLLSLGWNKIAFFLQLRNAPSTINLLLNISQVGIPFIGLIVYAYFFKKWRPYILGVSLVLLIIFGLGYKHI